MSTNMVKMVAGTTTQQSYIDTLLGRIAALTDENRRLRELLNYERAQGLIASQKLLDIESGVPARPCRKKKTREEKEAEAIKKLSKYKANGVKKATAVSEIRSYTDLKKLQEYFLNQGGANGARNYLLLTLGVCIGCRISDLVDLRFCQFFDDDRNPRERVILYEKKTSKLNNCLITEAMVQAFNKYFEITDKQFEFDAYVFPSRKAAHITPKSGWEVMDEAQKALGLPYNLGSHSLRKTFANIVACADKTYMDMGTIEKVQGLLNHNDSKVTMRYLGALQRMYDSARISVSDFVLGKTGIDELTLAGRKSVNDVYDLLLSVSDKIDMLEGTGTTNEN